MRRVIWPILTGLGVFFLVIAGMSRFYVAGQSVKFPLNEYSKSTLQGTASYFSAKQLQELSGVTMRVTFTVSGDVAAANATDNPNIAVWKSFTAIEDITHHQPFQYSAEKLAFNRTTGRLINCCGDYVGADHQRGLVGQGFVWPLNTQRHGYLVFDSTALRPVRYRFAGTAIVHGVSTYRFVAHILGQQIGAQTVPAALLGQSGPSVTLPEYYTATDVYYVDPVTGTRLKENERERITLRDSAGATRLVLLDGDLVSTPASIAASVSADQSNALKIQLVEVYLPIGAAVLGLVALIAGLALSRGRPQDGAVDRQDEESLGASA